MPSPRRLQLNATMTSSWHVVQRTRAKPCARMPLVPDVEPGRLGEVVVVELERAHQARRRSELDER